MMRSSGFALFLSIGLVSTALAQSATPTTGNVGSATLSNGFPAGGGVVALPSVQNSGTTNSTSAAGTTTSTSTNATTSTTGGSGGTGSGGGGGSTGRGSASTAGAATSTGSARNGNFVLCPPSGAPGLEPLFTGTDLSCAPQ
jgi:hypothetical protein